MLVDRDKNYLVAGTNTGRLSCYDLRFGVNVRRWSTTKKGPVYQISHYPSLQFGHCIIVAGGGSKNEISMWDMEKGICLRVLGLPEKEVKNWFPGSTKVILHALSLRKPPGKYFEKGTTLC